MSQLVSNVHHFNVFFRQLTNLHPHAIHYNKNKMKQNKQTKTFCVNDVKCVMIAKFLKIIDRQIVESSQLVV